MLAVSQQLCFFAGLPHRTHSKNAIAVSESHPEKMAFVSGKTSIILDLT